jgi:hypothetical protein
MATRLKTQEKRQVVSEETEEDAYTSNDDKKWAAMLAKNGIILNETPVKVRTLNHKIASGKLNARITSARTKNVRAAAEAWQTRTAIAEEGKRGREATREEGKAGRETTRKVGERIINENTKSLMKLNEIMNRNFETMNKNMLDGNKQLNLIIKDLGDGLKADILKLNGNLIEGFRKAFENQDLTAAEIKAKIDAAIDAFKGDLGDLKGIMDKNKEDLLRQLREKADEDKLKWEKFAGDLDGFKKEWEEKEKEKEKELEKAKAASEKYRKLKETKRVLVCPNCRGQGLAAHDPRNCQVTWDNGIQALGFRINKQLELTIPQVILEMIGGEIVQDVGVSGLYRLKHDLDLNKQGNLIELRSLIDEYTRDPDAFIEKYYGPPPKAPTAPFPIPRVGQSAIPGYFNPYGVSGLYGY